MTKRKISEPFFLQFYPSAKVTDDKIGGPRPVPWMTAEVTRASLRTGPGGTVTKWLICPSFPFKVVMKELSFSVLTFSSPKLTISTLT